MTLKQKSDFRNGFHAPENIEKVVLHDDLVKTGAKIWYSLFRMAAILNFMHTGYQGVTPTCMRWFLKTLYPYLTPCQISKTCHKVHNFSEFGMIPSPLSVNFNFSKPCGKRDFTWVQNWYDDLWTEWWLLFFHFTEPWRGNRINKISKFWQSNSCFIF